MIAIQISCIHSISFDIKLITIVGCCASGLVKAEGSSIVDVGASE
jgi:hypothetical protein